MAKDSRKQGVQLSGASLWHISPGFQAMGISIGTVGAILTIQIGDPSSIFALYLHVDNVNPNILSLLIESKGTQVL